MKVGFLSNKITMRGTEVTLYNYADYNERILGNESIIITRPYTYVMTVSPRDVSHEAYQRFIDRFQIEYYISPSDVEDIVRRHGIDVLFIEKAGSPTDGLVFNCCKTIIHAVFTTMEPHGDLYTPISDALNGMCNTNYPVLPYCVTVHPTTESLHEELGIPKDAIVFGSYSGADEYTVDYVKRAVIDIGKGIGHSHIYFIFMNIDPFCEPSERVRFLPGTVDMKRKRMFINTCHAMLYGRVGGETFGLACGEFSLCHKPVIGRAGEHSNAHDVILGDDMIRHTCYEELFDILTRWKKHNKDVSNNGYKQYTPEAVMKLFDNALTSLCAPRIEGSRDILFVSAFKDIGRDKWSASPRGVDQYIRNFLNLAQTITYRLIVFVEPDIEEALRTHSLPANIELRKSADVLTFYDLYIDNETRMMGSEEYRAKIPEDRRQAPEHWCPAYTLINHAKVNYIKHVKDNYPGYTYYAWIDFGCIQRTDNVPRNIDISKLTDKVVYLALREPPAVAIDANDMLRSHDIYITGASIVVHHSRVDEFEDVYSAKLEEWKARSICDDDQNLVLQLYFDNPGRFQLFYSNEWSSLYRNHLNRV